MTSSLMVPARPFYLFVCFILRPVRKIHHPLAGYRTGHALLAGQNYWCAGPDAFASWGVWGMNQHARMYVLYVCII